MNTPGNNHGVHWDLDASLSLPGSPFSDASTSESQNPTGSVQYINAQLLAHGFTQGPGLNLDGLGGTDLDRVVKCLLGMLSQRVEDMSRTEELTTKFRTLTYDYERLTSRHREAAERGANAEREMNVHKSKAAAASRTLQTTTNAHKHTSADLQRTRTSLQALRAAHQAELRKRDKEAERMVDRWAKLSDAQLKLASTAPAGLSFSGGRCANALASDGTEVLGRGQGYLELALEDAEKARVELAEENSKLRRMLLGAVNEAQGVVHELRLVAQEKADDEEPTPLTLATLFPLSEENVASGKLESLFSSFKGCITSLSDPNRTPRSKAAPPVETLKTKPQEDIVREKLQKTVEELKSELEQARAHSVQQTSQIQALFDQLATQGQTNGAHPSSHPTDISLELMSAPQQDEAKSRLDVLSAELAAERARFTAATIKLGKDRAALEKERAKLLEEKRAWGVAKMLDDLPPTPVPAAPSPPMPAPAPARKHREPRASPRKSPAKAALRSPAKPKGLSPAKALKLGKKTRVSRRSSLLAGLGGLALSPSRRGVVAAPFETEFMPLPAPTFELPTAHGTEGAHAVPSKPLPLLVDAFVLPPLSPHSKLPIRPALFGALDADAPGPSMTQPAAAQPPRTSTTPPLPAQAAADAPTPPAAPAPLPARAPPPVTPGTARAFPMARPFVRNFAHAFSPAKPSPLSRILMLADSPPGGSAPFTPMAPLLEGAAADDDDDDDRSPTPAAPPLAKPRSLAAELGLEDDDESPLREKREERNRPAGAEGAGGGAPRLTAQEKGKGRAEPAAPAARVRGGPAPEKENDAVKKSRGGRVPVPAAAVAPKIVAGRASAKPGKPPAGAAVPRPGAANGVKVPTGKVGPRRVPVEPARRAFA